MYTTNLYWALVSCYVSFCVQVHGKNVRSSNEAIETTMKTLKPILRTGGEPESGEPSEETSFVPTALRNNVEPYNKMDWEYWCHLQPKIGNGPKFVKNFYYDTMRDRCKTFAYSGAGGNQNHFSLLEDCEQFCRGFGSVRSFLSMQPNQQDCSLQHDPGTCIGNLERYYFNVNSGRCQPFVYSGCGGNRNRFLTEDSCMQQCADNT